MDPATPSRRRPQSAARAARKAAVRRRRRRRWPPAVSRLVLTGQEDLRREIARAMHDGPAQSLTNIVLQAQIVERLVAKDPALGAGRGPPADRHGPADPRGDQDVHLRRPAHGPRRPGPRADVAAVGPRAWAQDRRRGRLRFHGPGPTAADGPRERALPHARRGPGRATSSGHRPASRCASTGPTRWRHACTAVREKDKDAKPAADPAATSDAAPTGAELPPALAAMMEDRRADARDAVEAARRDAIVALPVTTWQEIQSRASHARHPRRPVGGRLGAPPRCRGAGADGAMTCAARRGPRPGPRRVRTDPRPDRRVHGRHPRGVRRDRGGRPCQRSARRSTRRPAERDRRRSGPNHARTWRGRNSPPSGKSRHVRYHRASAFRERGSI